MASHYQHQHSSSFNVRTSSGGMNGQPPQSQYFQSFDASHLTAPPNHRPIYTTEQKDTAIRLLNEGNPVKTIVSRIGGSCSKSNPYRWRVEESERARRAEADRQGELLIQQRKVQQQVQRNNFLQNDVVVIVILCAFVAELITFFWTLGTFITFPWLLWRIWIMRWIARLGANLETSVRFYFLSLAILWVCMYYNFGTAPLLVRTGHFPYIAFNW